MVIKVEVFSTNSCPHCPAAIDAAQKAKSKLGDAIDVESVKIDESPDNRQRAVDYQIMAVPTICLLYTSPSPRDADQSRMPSSA